MKARKVTITLEVETNLGLKELRNPLFWESCVEGSSSGLGNGEVFNTTQATAQVIQPVRVKKN